MRRLVEALESQYLPLLRTLASELAREYPRLRCTVFSYSVGSSTPYPGHSMGIDCLFPECVQDGSDNLSLSIGISRLDAGPRIMADVVWGHPSGHIEDEFAYWKTVDDWPQATPEKLEQLAESFDRLSRTFRQVVRRSFSEL